MEPRFVRRTQLIFSQWGMQFTINRVIIKLFGTMSQNYYQEVSNYFGINTVKELIRNRFKKFKISYGAADNYLCRLISAKC